MPPSTRDAATPSPLTPVVFHILLALSDGPLHGYAIMQAVDEAAAGSVSVGPGTIYGSLQRMEEAGLVEELAPEGRRRRFGVTPLGRGALLDESARLARLSELAHAKGLTPEER